MYRSDDPIADFDRYDAEQQRSLNRLPHCDDCGEPIYECYYKIDGGIVCEECLDNYRRSVEL